MSVSTTNGRGAIINVESLLSPDITFVIEDKRWTISGDIKARTMLEVQHLANEMDRAMESGDAAAAIEAFGKLHDFLVPLFQYKQPDLTEIPWDFQTFLKVVGVIVARAMGADAMDIAAAISDPPREMVTASKSSSPTRSRSTPRSGSARS